MWKNKNVLFLTVIFFLLSGVIGFDTRSVQAESSQINTVRFNEQQYAKQIIDFMNGQDTSDVKLLFKNMVDKEQKDIQIYGDEYSETIKLLWGSYIFFDIGFVGKSKLLPLLNLSLKTYPYENNAGINLYNSNTLDSFLPGTETWTLKIKNQENNTEMISVAYYTPHSPTIKENEDKVIVMHRGFRGKIDNGNDMAETRTFYDKGYNILYVDNRATSLSQGEYITFGQYESDDVLEWINYLNNTIQSNQQIVLYGGSMGAATMLSVLAKQPPMNVTGVIENAGFSNIREQLIYSYDSIVNNVFLMALIDNKVGVRLEDAFLMVPENNKKIVTSLNDSYIKPIANVDIDGNLPIKGVQNTNLPILFIHGMKDNVVPYSNLETLSSLSQGPIYTFSVPDAGHLQAQTVDPIGYDKAITDFLSAIFHN
uniref:Hydrolase n=1 Tax=Enterococcus faecium TaxID=1352 RepID=A0A0D5MBK2_ENTFC|nr:alpha/beta hydrolase [Enterococcus faecium]AJY53556.1 hydrolase [Enterococcus faecium]